MLTTEEVARMTLRTVQRDVRVRLLALAAAAALVFSLFPSGMADAAHFADNTRRIVGDADVGRFGTAAEIALEAFPDGADDVVLARGDEFPDALAGALVAGQVDAPILLSEGSTLTGVTADAIAELAGEGTVTVHLAGGTEALSEAVAEEADALGFVDGVNRISGPTRYETAEEITKFIAEVDGFDGYGQAPTLDAEGGVESEELLTTAILATGVNFADALASSPLAYVGQHPLLLSVPDQLHPAAERGLVDAGVEQVLIAGGEGALSAQVAAEVEALGINVARINQPGGDRTTTAAQFAGLIRAVAYEPYTSDVDGLAIANGFDDRGGADALALAPLAAKTEKDLVLTRGVDTVNGTVPESGEVQPETFIRANCAGFGAEEDPVVIAGGTQAISESAEAEISSFLICEDFVASGDLTVEPAAAVTPVGAEHTVDVAGTNPNGDPAEGAFITFEVFREGEAADGDYVYTEAGRTFVHVDDERQVAQLDEDGEAAFAYTHDEVADDRLVVTAPPVPPQDPDEFQGVDDDGNLKEGPYGNTVVSNLWSPGEPDQQLFIELNSSDEVAAEPPLDVVPGDDDGPFAGSLILSFYEDFDLIQADVQMLEAPEGEQTGSYSSDDSPGVHIHEGLSGDTGPVVAAFGKVSDETLASNSFWTVPEGDAGELLDEILANPEEHYFNVHTDLWTGGIARGQLDGSDTDDPDASSLTLTPAGENEVGLVNDPPNPLGPAGSTEGTTGTADFDYFDAYDIVGYSIEIDNKVDADGTFQGFVDATGLPATHIHVGLAGVNDAVVLPLLTLDDETDSASGFVRAGVEVEGPDEPLIDLLQSNPERYYLNVHTDVWTGGVARAQFDGIDDGNPDDSPVTPDGMEIDHSAHH